MSFKAKISNKNGIDHDQQTYLDDNTLRVAPGGRGLETLDFP